MPPKCFWPIVALTLAAGCGGKAKTSDLESLLQDFLKGADLPYPENAGAPKISADGWIRVADDYVFRVSESQEYVLDFTNLKKTQEIASRTTLPNSILIRNPQEARIKIGELALHFQFPVGADIVSFDTSDKGVITADFRVFPERFPYKDPKYGLGMKLTVDGQDGKLVRFSQKRDTVVENTDIVLSKAEAIARAEAAKGPAKESGVVLQMVPVPGSESRVRLAYIIEAKEGEVWVDAADGSVLNP
jgi:hypothetical protein